MSASKNWKTIIWKKSNGACSHCGKKVSFQQQTIDHVIPQAFGGTNDQRNLMPLCRSCNKSRASGEIIPETYYKYVAPLAIEELYDYIALWKAEHTTASGEMTVERYGIIERDAPDKSP